MGSYIKYLLVYIVLVALVFFGIFQKIKNKPDRKPVKLSMILKAEKKDKILLYYKTPHGKYTEQNTLKRDIMGGNVQQTIEFNLPAEASTVRLHVSRNKQKNAIAINEIQASDGLRIKKYRKRGMIEYFRPNKFIEKLKVVNNDVLVNTKPIKGQYNPFFHEISLEYLLW